MMSQSLIGRSAWNLGSQTLNTGANLALAIAAAGQSTPEAYGAWAIAYLSYIIAIAINRAIVNTPLLLSSGSDAEKCRSRRGAVGACIALAIIGSCVLLVLSAVVSGELQYSLIMFAAVLPGVVLQDTVRYIHIGDDKPRSAALVDGVRFVLQVIIFICLLALGNADANTLTAGWGISALVTALFFLVAARIPPRIRDTYSHFTARPGVLLRLLVDASLMALAANSLPLIIAAFLSLQEVGYFRAAQTLMGGVGLIVRGLVPLLTVESVKRLKSGSSPRHIVAFWSAAIALGSAIYGAGILAIPDDWGELAVGQSFAGAETVLVALVLQAVLRGPLTGVPAVLKAQGRFNELVFLRIGSSVIAVSIAIAGVAVWELQGAGWALAVAAIAGGMFSYYVLQRPLRRSE